MPFDPSKPFEVIEPSAGGFDPSQPFEQVPNETGILKRGWDALNRPAEMSRAGFKATADLANSIAGDPSGNLVTDVLKGTPGVVADTLGEVAPSFIDRTAILTAGGAKLAKEAAPLVAAAGRQVGKAAESISGLEYKTPGILKEAFNDKNLIAAPGKKAAGALYPQTDNVIRQALKEIPDHKDQVDAALTWAKDGTLTPAEALEARKSLDVAKKQFTGAYYRWARETLDSIAKQETKMADAAYSLGVKADALRNVFPQNKLGGTSIAKSAIGSLAGVFPMLAMSPLVQGTTATTLGMGSRAIAPLLEQAIRTGAATGAGSSELQKLIELARQRGAR